MDNEIIDLKLNIYPIKHMGKAVILIKTEIHDTERIHEILRKAFRDEALFSKIEIKNKWKALPKLVKMNLLKKEQINKDTLLKEFLPE